MEESQENDKILMVWKKIRKFLSNVTLEPIMFLWSIAFPMQMVSTKQLVIGAQKISKTKFVDKSPEYKQYRDLPSPLSRLLIIFVNVQIKLASMTSIIVQRSVIILLKTKPSIQWYRMKLLNLKFMNI